MPNTLPDATALLLYKNIIVPWETSLKNESGCWDVKRTRELLKPTDIHLESVEIGEVEVISESLQKSGKKNFIVFVSSSSQMKDLFRLLRNCAAHASFTTQKAKAGESTLRFKGTLRRRSDLAVSGQLAPESLAQVVATLVTTPKAQRGDA